jgi:hypothetical protein
VDPATQWASGWVLFVSISAIAGFLLLLMFLLLLVILLSFMLLQKI